MGIYGNFILENYIKNEPDIYYNKDKFDSGEINLCFITGHSGSGKSTMARNMSNDIIEYYELDDVYANKINFTMENFKEYGDLIYSFFKGPGKKYYYTKEDIDNGSVKKYEGDYDRDLIVDFVNYTKHFAKSHKNKKYVIEGIWIYLFIEPEELKDYAVYIKGTSRLISDIRAAKRDSKEEFPNDNLKITKHFIGRAKNFFTKEAKTSEQSIRNYRKYFTNLSMKSISESVDRSTVDKNFKKKQGKSFKYIDIKTNKSIVEKYLNKDRQYNKTYKKYINDISGEIVIDEDNDKLAGYVFVIDKFITPLFVVKDYRGYGLGDILTKDAVKKYGARRLWVYKDNEVAIRLYKKYGFKVYLEDDEPSILMATEEKYAKEIIDNLK